MTVIELTKTLPNCLGTRGDVQKEIASLCTDSRTAQPGAMFFCIRGLRVDAHDFAPQAVEKGAAALVVERYLDIDCAQVLVKDVREALSYIASAFYGEPAKQMKIIGITGTKGKTTTSFLVKSILEEAGHKVGMIGTVCSMIGQEEIPSNLTTPDPVDFHSLLRQMADAGVEYVVMEVSAHALALRKMEGIFFEVAAFTNLSQDHLDFFRDMDTYLGAKMRLFDEKCCRVAIYNADNESVCEAMQGVNVPAYPIAIRKKSDIFAKNIEPAERGVEYLLSFYKRYSVEIKLRLTGIFNVYNSMMAAAICDVLGVSGEDIAKGLASIASVPGRIELLDTDTNYRVILDYAHSPDALENILATVRQTAKARLIALFGCGGDRDHEKRPMMGEIGGRLADFSILTSDNPRGEDPYRIIDEIERGMRRTQGAYTVIENRRAAIKIALKMAREGDVIVLAGKGHETYQEIKGVKYPFDEKIVVQELLKEIAGEAQGV
ncbi:MAG: UDP-N-acetylmuramoyl-L-alanyl-D-glutamate--2,6-diaminopimelate ligase [Christensenellales bacterium]|jgi:UDP-N-acetylmuramoyl-L-alanyl-D-glutamate--2,6-diaminopimelate ligase